jgi:transcriptional antiterminator RfaH
MTIPSSNLHNLEEPLWFCLKAQPKREHIAAAALKQIPAVDVLAPRIRYQKATRRGPVWFMEAMFPGYFFAHFHFAAQHRYIQSMPGVSGIVTFGEQVAVLDPNTINGIRTSTGNEDIAVYSPTFQVGDPVKIVDGSFQGLESVITQVLPARERVKVLLEFLGRSVEVEIALPHLLSATSPRTACLGT